MYWTNIMQLSNFIRIVEYKLAIVYTVTSYTYKIS